MMESNNVSVYIGKFNFNVCVYFLGSWVVDLLDLEVGLGLRFNCDIVLCFW